MHGASEIKGLAGTLIISLCGSNKRLFDEAAQDHRRGPLQIEDQTQTCTRLWRI